MKVIREIAPNYDPGVPVIAELLTGTTDNRTFRSLGVIAYGFEPYRVTEADLDTQHGANERLSIANLARAIHFVHDVVAAIAE
jgi:carboxypeptidase PM20D1